MNLERIIKEALPALQKTGTWIQKEAQSFDLNKVVLKGKNDLVSYVDKDAEKKLVTDLKKYYQKPDLSPKKIPLMMIKKNLSGLSIPKMAQLITYMGCPYILSALGPYKAEMLLGVSFMN